MPVKTIEQNRRVTIKDIARVAGVSHTCVSRALLDKPDISEKTKKRIKALAEKLNYVPNETARNLVTKKTFTVCLSIGGHTLDNPFYGELVKHIEEEAKRNNYSLVLNVIKSPASKKDFDLLQRKRVDGLILPENIYGYEESILWLKRRQTPVVFYENLIHTMDSVTVDRSNGVFQAIGYLVGLGHKDFGFVCLQNRDILTPTRFAGFQKGLKRNNLPLREEWIIDGIGTVDDGYRAAEILLKQKELPTAVFCHNDLAAMGCIASFSEHGLVVPDDVSVVGFDNIKIAQYTQPPLTTIEQPLKKLAGNIMRVLMKKMENPEREYEQVTLEPKLVIRRSTGPVRAKKGGMTK